MGYFTSSCWFEDRCCSIMSRASRRLVSPCLTGHAPERLCKNRPTPADKEKKMPKLKTHTGAAKRFSKTGTGKIKRGQTKTRHILTSKGPKTKRKLGKTVLVSDGDYKKVARMIPYA